MIETACRPVISKNYTHFRCCAVLSETYSMEWGGHHGVGFYVIDAFFAKICTKNDFHILQ